MEGGAAAAAEEDVLERGEGYVVGLVHGPVDEAALVSEVRDESCGAISTFLGTTRDNFAGKRVVSLSYEAYGPMAIEKMRELAVDIRRRFDGVRKVVIVHRVGDCPVPETSVCIAVSSAHRRASLHAVATCIDELKATVPIWKKEVYDGDAPATWKENPEFKRRKLEIAGAESAPAPPAAEEDEKA